ncbi:AdoMet-homocysteine methyltransferase, partial [Teratosphaeriaceae sp. CCFEE 6253]
MPSYPEIKALLALLKAEFPSTTAWVSCTLRDAAHLSDGTPMADVFDLAQSSDQIVAFGVNCVPENIVT